MTDRPSPGAAASPAPPRAGPARADFLALFSAVMLPMFMAAVDQTLLATATPRIAAELGGLSDTSWIVVGYLLGSTVTAPVYGRLGDRFGRRAALLGALAVFAAGSLACAAAGSMAALIAARALQGLGGGGLMVLSQALIGELVAPIERPRYQAWFATVFTASSVGGPVVGGLVVHHADWRWLFYANLPLAAIAAWRVARLPAAPRSALRDAPTDPWGLVMFAATASSALLWLTLGGHRFAWDSGASVALLVLAVVGALLLARQQRRHPSPLLPLELLRLPGAGWICATVVCFASSLFALLFLLPIQLQLGRGDSASSAGWQMLPVTLGLVLGSTLNSRITARTAMPSRTPPFGLGASALALAALALAPPVPWFANVAAGVVGLGFGTVMPNAQLSLQMLAGRGRLGAAAALLSLTRSLGASIGTAAYGALVFALLQHAPTGDAEVAALRLGDFAPAQVTHAFRIACGVLAGVVALGAWMATRVPKVRLTHWEDHDDAATAPVAQ